MPGLRSLFGWDVESRCRCGAPWAAQLFPPRKDLKVGALRVVSALVRRRVAVGGRWPVAGAGVGASRGVPAFKRARGRPPGGPEDRPSLHRDGPTS